MNEKLMKLNQIPIEESSSSGNEMEYILIKNSKENISILKELGMSDNDYENMTDRDDDEYIEIAYFGFFVLHANWWSIESGFIM